MHWITDFDSSAFIITIIGKHWLLLSGAWGIFKIYAKHSKGTVDDEIVQMVEALRNEKRRKDEGVGAVS